MNLHKYKAIVKAFNHPRNSQLSLAFLASSFAYVLYIAFSLVDSPIFLGDQLDQTLQLMYLFQGKVELFYGPVYSGTEPPVYALGSIPSLFFSIPFFIGMDPAQTQYLHLLLGAVTIIPVFLILRRTNMLLCYSFITILLISPLFWWTFSIYWVNIFQAYFGLIAFALLVRFFEKPDLNKLIHSFLPFLLGLHIHSTVMVVLPVYLVAGLYWLFYSNRRGDFSSISIFNAIALFVIIGPYVFMEFVTGFSNGKAAIAHMTQNHTVTLDSSIGLQAAFDAWSRVLDYTVVSPSFYSIEPFGRNLKIVLEALIFISISFVFIRSLVKIKGGQHEPIDFLNISLPLVFLAQFFFFLKANRPLLGPHYTLFILPFYILVCSNFVSLFLKMLPKKEAILIFLSAFFIHLYGDHKYRLVERQSWTFDNIKTSLLEICRDVSDFGVIADPNFYAYRAYYPNVIQFVMQNFIEECDSFQESDQYLILASRFNNFSQTLDHRDQKYSLQKKFHPGIALYRLDSLPIKSL